MKIISKETDYYDYISNVYGVDNLIVYNRMQSLDHVKHVKVNESVVDMAISLRNLAYHYKDVEEKTKPIGERRYFKYYMLCIVDRIYAVKSIRETYGDHYPNGKGSNLIAQDKTIEYVKNHWGWTKPTLVEGVMSDPNHVVARAFGTPVVLFNGDIDRELSNQPSYHNTLKIEEACIPCLKTIGNIVNLISAEEVYQLISLFLGQEKNQNPPIEVSNEVKITQAGFDLKKSFRHRK